MATYVDLIQEGAAHLNQAGIETPTREARLLMLLAAKLDSARLIAIERDEIGDSEIVKRFGAFVERRAGREPFAHIAGQQGFYGLDFISDARALVPRADSEIVVEIAIGLLDGRSDASVADLGAGSGCLLGAILHNAVDAKGQAVERDPGAASLALENLKRHGFEARSEVITADWAAWTGWGEVDLIISNPPYIVSDEIDRLDDDVRLFDPLVALDGGADGLEAYRAIVGLAASQMKPGAWLVFEIGYDQDAAVRALMGGAGFEQIQGARDLGGNDRAVYGCRP